MTLGLRPSVAACVTFSLTLALALVVTLVRARDERARAMTIFEALALRVVDRLSARMQTYEHGVRGARGAVAAVGVSELDRRRFRAYIASRPVGEQPGARGFGVIERVRAGDEAAFVAAARRDGYPGFAIRQLSVHDGDRYVIRYIEPIEDNLAAVGLDVASEVERRAATEASMRSGTATITAPITLVQAADRPAQALLMMLPIYRAGADVATVAEREAATLGWTYSTLLVDEVLRGVDVEGRSVTLALSDAGSLAQQSFFCSPGCERAASFGLARKIALPMFGRTWTADVRATPQFMLQLGPSDPRVAAVASVALAGLFAALAYLLSLRTFEARMEQVRRYADIERSHEAMIGETLRSQQALAAAQRDNAALLQTLHRHAIVSMADRAGQIIDVNESFCRISGYTREELLGQNHRIVNSGVHGRAFWIDVWRTIASGRSWRGEVCNRAKDGSLYWVDSIFSPFVGEDGAIEKYISIRTDITARKLMEERLRETNDRFEIASSAAGVGFWEYDVAAGTLSWDQRMFWLYGASPSGGEEPYALWSGSLHPEDRAGAEEDLQRAIRGVRKFDTEFRIVRPSGDTRYIKAVANVVRDDAGRALRMTGVNVDVTEHKNAEATLRATSSLLGTVLSSASEVSIIATDPDLLITVFNTGAERLLGYSGEELIGRGTSTLIHDAAELDARARELGATLGHAVESQRVLTEPSTLGHAREWTFIRKDGDRVPVSLVVTPMRDGDGALFGYLGIAHNVSRQKEQERALREAMHKAKQANRAKSQFLANMSHEIRTPMNAVIGLSYLLERTALTSEQTRHLQKIKLASKALLTIINNVLDLSKIEAAELKIERAPFSLATLVEDLSALMAVQAEARGVGFSTEVADGLPPMLEGDVTRLHQVLSNLLANAIKFTERGAVRLVIRQVSSAAEKVRLRATVEDSGIGIPPDRIPGLFAPFAQGDASTTRRFGGTGLGLSIVKQLVGLMGGEVGASSTPNVGSAFWVELDFTTCPDATPVVAPTARALRGSHLRGVRVLVADDSAINLEVATRILELEGAEVSQASNGQEVVDHLLIDPGAFDVVLMDVQMPVLDGHDAARRIRGGLGLLQLPIIALTAGTLTSEQQQAEAAGMNAFVSKPFEPQALLGCIRRLLTIAGDDAEREIERAPSLAPGWPDIAGIDARDACVRMGGDLELFRSMLRRLLNDFTDLRGSAPLDAARLPALAAHLHDLKGSAGTLGARPLARIAAEADTACRGGDLARGEELIGQVAQQIDEMRRAAEAALDLWGTEEQDEPDFEEARYDGDALSTLMEQLRGFDFAAVDQFGKLAPGLRRALGDESYALLREQMENLQFSDAARTLEDLPR